MQIAIRTINTGLSEDPRGFIRQADAAFDGQLAHVAADIVETHRQCPIVLLSGPSGSGKTTTARILEHKLRQQGITCHTISMDEYFHPLDEEKRAQMARGKLDLESPDRVDAPTLNAQLTAILAGEPTELPHFDFATHQRVPSGRVLTRGGDDVVIVEGIHALNPAVVTLPDGYTTRLYVSVRTRLQREDGSLLHPSYIRLLRRLLRDRDYRHRQLTDTLAMYDSVQRGEKRYILPYKPHATHDIDTFFAYEVAVYRERLYADLLALGDDPRLTDLLASLREVTPLSPAAVPAHSLIREFIGGSVYYEDNVVDPATTE